MMNKVLTGICKVYKRWDLIWLEDKSINKQDALNYFKFEGYLRQIFNGEYLKKILDAINTDKVLIIDFDEGKAKVVKEKDRPYIQEMTKYFTPSYQQSVLDGTIEKESDTKIDIRNL